VRDDVTFLGQSSLTFDLGVADNIVQHAIDAKTQKTVRPQTFAYQTPILHLMLDNNRAALQCFARQNTNNVVQSTPASIVSFL